MKAGILITIRGLAQSKSATAFRSTTIEAVWGSEADH